MRTLPIAAASMLAALTASAQAQDIGIPACDAILKTYTTCVVPKVPEAGQAAMKSTFDQLKTNWTAVAATPDGKKQLEGVCKQTADQMKQQLAAMNCQW